MQSVSPNLLALARRRNHLGSFSCVLASVLSAQTLDLLVGHRRGPVRVEELPRVPRPEVVLHGPNAGGEILARIAQPGLADVYQPVSYTHLRAHETRHDLVC